VFTIIHSTIIVNSYESYNYSVTDMNGRNLKKGIVQSGQTSIDASAFPKGIYVIRYENPVSSYSEKMVKQ
ncbi:MAG TPA: T9SS type A sorting domain-containing protein, partial [Flavisolibacter sp.]|nr:T9SS type A sorting domain-containing protein [Flavisolibacter sp.]